MGLIFLYFQEAIMFYHKVYMNQIHSSSLLCQLASMWKNQVLCDAVIKAGNSQIKVSIYCMERNASHKFKKYTLVTVRVKNI